jgi:hypothetical protein
MKNAEVFFSLIAKRWGNTPEAGPHGEDGRNSDTPP